ncbi:hypothetical protein SCALM49S_02645 [Streptomyces californicus]
MLGLPWNEPEAAFRLLSLGQGILVVALAVVARGLYLRAPDPRTVLRGLGGPVVAMLACALGGVMTGGVAQRVADWLDGPGTPGMGHDTDIPGPPVVLSWQASVIPVLLILLLVPVVFLVVRTARRARRLGPVIEAEYAPEQPDEGRTRRIAGIRATAALTDSAPWIVGVVSAATLLLGAGAVAGAWVSDEVPGRAADGRGPLLESLADAAQSTGSWLIGLGFILFVAGGRRAYKDASARRTIGILWDVGTFWPRAAHPFAPPATPNAPSPTSRPGCRPGRRPPLGAGWSSRATHRAASSPRPPCGNSPTPPAAGSPCSPTDRPWSGCTDGGSRPTSAPNRCWGCTGRCAAGATCGGRPIRSAAPSGSAPTPTRVSTGAR